MSYTATFQRVEKKYLLNERQYQRLLPVISEFMQTDSYGETAVCNLYLDTADDLLVRRSIEKPAYKEKLRLRSYSIPGEDSPVYLEIKKKVYGVVYKRRVALGAGEAMAYLLEDVPPRKPGQILCEIEAMRSRYRLLPKLYLAYDRTAYFEREPGADALRITIDRRIRSRENDMDLRLGDAGIPLLPEGTRLMEVKTARAIPLWLCGALSANQVYPASFSKYGRVYQARVAGLAAPVARPARQKEPRRTPSKEAFPMLTALFETSSGLSAVSALVLILCAAACGLAIALAAMLMGECGKSFAISPVALPIVSQVVILMVNGNLGAGVAVLGAFSLIRFRSVPGTSRDITLIFLAMAAGLATGMAYAGYAFLVTAVVCGIMVLLSKLRFGEWRQPLRLRVTIPEDLDYTGVFDSLFAAYTTRHSLESVKTVNMGSLFELRYSVVLKEPRREKEFLDALRCLNGNLTITLNHGAACRDEL